MNTVDKYKVYQVNPTTGLPVTVDPATQTTLAALVALFPTSLGQKVKTTSLAVSPPSDYQQPILPTNATLAWTNISASGADGVPDTDVSNYRSGTVQLSGTWAATVNVQFSLDGTTWINQATYNEVNSGSVVSGITTNGLHSFNIPAGVHMRIRTAAYSSGTIIGSVAVSSITQNHYPQTLAGTNVASGSLQAVQVASLTADAQTLPSYGLSVGATLLGFTGATSDRLRIPNIFKTAIATASGDTAVWTPTSGKKFRLMRFRIEVTGQSTQAVSGNLEIIFRDASTGMPIGCSIFVPSVSLNQFASYSTGWIDLGNGILSAAANNVLNINLGAALATGEARVIVCGTEE